tara:strand:+ start:433 stop:615 length:183 start_codon:yes stop_codon:yes gene_type:complete
LPQQRVWLTPVTVVGMIGTNVLAKAIGKAKLRNQLISIVATYTKMDVDSSAAVPAGKTAF